MESSLAESAANGHSGSQTAAIQSYLSHLDAPCEDVEAALPYLARLTRAIVGSLARASPRAAPIGHP